jgi:hypothetical protein
LRAGETLGGPSTSFRAGPPCASTLHQRSSTIRSRPSGPCGKAGGNCYQRWLAVPLTSKREQRLHPYDLHRDREEGAGSPPASSCLFPSSQLFCKGCSHSVFS